MISPGCAESSPGFPSLIEGLARTKVHSDGSFVKRGHFTHGPDGLRYLAWRFLPRPKPLQRDAGFDEATFDALRRIKIFGSE